MLSLSLNVPDKAEQKGEVEEMATVMQSQFKYMFPVMTVFITFKLPAGVALYWFVSTVFGIIQTKILA